MEMELVKWQCADVSAAYQKPLPLPKADNLDNVQLRETSFVLSAHFFFYIFSTFFPWAWLT